MAKQSGPELLFTFRTEIGALRSEMRTGLQDVQQLLREMITRIDERLEGFKTAVDRRFEKVEGAMEGIIEAYGEQFARVDRVEAEVEEHAHRLDALEAKKPQEH